MMFTLFYTDPFQSLLSISHRYHQDALCDMFKSASMSAHKSK